MITGAFFLIPIRFCSFLIHIFLLNLHTRMNIAVKCNSYIKPAKSSKPVLAAERNHVVKRPRLPFPRRNRTTKSSMKRRPRQSPPRLTRSTNCSNRSASLKCKSKSSKEPMSEFKTSLIELDQDCGIKGLKL